MSLYDDLKKIEEVEEVVVKAQPIEKPILEQAVRNLPGSTLKLGKDLLDLIINPVTTAKSILDFLADGSEKHVEVVKDYAFLQKRISPATFYNALSTLIKEGKVEKLRHGYYKLKKAKTS